MNDLAFAYHPPRPPKYHITAINPLTRLREPVTLPCSKEKAEKMLAKRKKKPPGKRTWLYPKLEIYPPQQQRLIFEP